MDVKNYIQQNWKATIRTSAQADNSFIKLPKPYTVPCAKTLFTNFFYWDTYFANLGLMLDGMEEQAKNNLDNMAFFIKALGFVPNADHLITRTQPPLFTRGVYDYYMHTQDKRVIQEYKDMICKEFSFFENDRMTEIGLNAYKNDETNRGKLWYYDEFNRRLGYTEEEKSIEKFTMTDHLLAIAESGWDFNPRFSVEGNRFASQEFAHLDLNCLLFDAEQKFAYMLSEIGEESEAETWRKKAQKRAELINQYMLDPKTGLYFDYNYKRKCVSKTLCAAAFYPYAFGISKDKDGAKETLRRLALEHGISACEYRGEDATYFQWDYPSMWPSNMYFAYVAMKNLDLQDEAKWVKNAYMGTVKRVFARTGDLWEKYDAKLGDVSVTSEYDTPDMMGWTAGVYRYMQEN
jgi:alpha,alpha-trehalase